MKPQIINQTKNPNLKREEFILEFNSEVTPSFDEIKKSLGKEEDLTVVKKVHANFGKRKFLADVFVYEDSVSLKEIETIPKKIRKKMEAEEKKRLEEEKKAAAEAKKAEEEAKAKAEEETRAAEEAAKAKAESTEETKTEEVKVEEEIKE